MIIKRRNPSLAEISKRVQEEFRCSHVETIRCKKLKSNNTEEFRNQCKKCGVQVGKAIRKDTLSAQDRAEMPLWNDEIGKSFHDAMAARSNALYQEDEKRSLEEWQAQYDAYRRTPEWRARRQLVLLRAHGICEGCRSAPATEVHHLYYDSLGEEFLFDLVAICEKCHARFHGRMDRERRS
jgi:5-methylcytosine-specific restriction endonuclease McrA